MPRPAAPTELKTNCSTNGRVYKTGLKQCVHRCTDMKWGCPQGKNVHVGWWWWWWFNGEQCHVTCRDGVGGRRGGGGGSEVRAAGWSLNRVLGGVVCGVRVQVRGLCHIILAVFGGEEWRGRPLGVESLIRACAGD